ncbi:MAG: hypothetical protein Pg6C_00120 [Treponemataceae bacterium]|nr:MAG: hypothetical protein Pg6C_00120 [Treponemataceae bacterium]
MAQKVTFPIGFKLITIITVLLLLSLGAITALVSYLVGADVRITAEENNNAINRRSAQEAKRGLETVRESVFFLLDMISVESASRTSAPDIERVARYFFARNPNIAAVIIYDGGEYVNEPFFEKNEINAAFARNYALSLAEYAEEARSGTDTVLNAAPHFGQGILAYVCGRDTGQQPVIALFFGRRARGIVFLRRELYLYDKPRRRPADLRRFRTP